MFSSNVGILTCQGPTVILWKAFSDQGNKFHMFKFWAQGSSSRNLAEWYVFKSSTDSRCLVRLSFSNPVSSVRTNFLSYSYRLLPCYLCLLLHKGFLVFLAHECIFLGGRGRRWGLALLRMWEGDSFHCAIGTLRCWRAFLCGFQWAASASSLTFTVSRRPYFSLHPPCLKKRRRFL